MELHRSIAAWLAITTGAFNLLILAAVALCFGIITSFILVDSWVMSFVATFGVFLAICFGAFSFADIIAGIYLLRGSKIAEVWLILTSVLSLFKFPVGTAIGAYTLWALLRTVETMHQKPAETSDTNYFIRSK
jgi:hypothetical protein